MPLPRVNREIKLLANVIASPAVSGAHWDLQATGGSMEKFFKSC